MISRMGHRRQEHLCVCQYAVINPVAGVERCARCVRKKTKGLRATGRIKSLSQKEKLVVDSFLMPR